MPTGDNQTAARKLGIRENGHVQLYSEPGHGTTVCVRSKSYWALIRPGVETRPSISDRIIRFDSSGAIAKGQRNVCVENMRDLVLPARGANNTLH